jgi:hypothetical protein
LHFLLGYTFGCAFGYVGGWWASFNFEWWLRLRDVTDATIHCPHVGCGVWSNLIEPIEGLMVADYIGIWFFSTGTEMT